ncbi:MAG: HAD-IA family hydrolase [Gammaproteobacteria bacterium]|nr:HAD-IA family hydrolase [Gammaproteobacteria bacterium]
MLQTILFDLDGTLLDTAPDLAYALNTLRQEQNLEPLAFDEIRPVVSHGGQALIKLGFAHINKTEHEPLRKRLLEIYQNNIANKTRLFPGMNKVLDYIESNNMNWGVVTNKPSWLTDPLMKALNLYDRSVCVISGDTTENRKPHPQPILHACTISGRTVNECLYIGDAERDIQAGRHAGMKTLIAMYGYIEAQDNPESWGADDYINTPEEIIDWLQQQDQ